MKTRNGCPDARWNALPGILFAPLLPAALLLAALPRAVTAQGGGALDVAFLGATLSWAEPVGGDVALGVALGGGMPAAVTLIDGELSDGRDGGPPSLVGEIVHGAVFLRHRTPDGRVEVEWGPRVAWAYHAATEYESIFVGLYGALFRDVGRVRVGARASFGRYEEEAGRSELNLALVPLLVRFRLPGAGGRVR